MKRIIPTLICCVLAGLPVHAADFFSTEECEEMFELGVRVGINTSNRTLDRKAVGGYDYQSWGTGFSAGVVADLNIRDYIAIQPGIFFESRSGHYNFVTPVYNNSETPYYVSQSGHRHTYNFTVPVLASLRFNVTDELRWLVEAGPYVAFMLSSKLEDKEVVSSLPATVESVPLLSPKPASVDFGFKIGTGLELFDHYYVGIHYEAGAVKGWKDQEIGDNLRRIYGGRTKAWVFTLGYNF